MFGGYLTVTQFLNGAALVPGAGLMFSGMRAIRRREVDAEGHPEGSSAFRLGWLGFFLGLLLIVGVVFDLDILRMLFRLFLEASNGDAQPGGRGADRL